jgi:CO/xanthine dehydrogenase Mo-binding subunit
MDARRRILDETVAARAKALELLKSLTDLQAGADPSARDLFKRVTGQSSIDNSIAATRRAIEAYDRVLVQLEAEPPVVSVGAAGTQGSPTGAKP